MKSTKELLKTKRDGGAWTSDEIEFFVRGVVSGAVSTPQAAAFLMAACTRGLDTHETAALTHVMASSGRTLPRVDLAIPRVDKHSTGGVGDKVSLLLAPLAASCGLHVPMISGRGLGHTGGTLDKLESVLGLTTRLSEATMNASLKNHGFFMAGQTETLAPADKILYALRDVTGTVEHVGLITASILSKKIAETLDALVLDVKVGKGAFMETMEQAYDLATSLRNVCTSLGVRTSVVFSRMDSPLGRSVGNWDEILEAERALAGNDARSNLKTVTIACTAHMVFAAQRASTYHDAVQHVERVWASGEAHDRFHAMITAQGGRWSESVEYYRSVPSATIVANTDGYVPYLPAREVANIVNKHGAGRTIETDVIDSSAGFTCVPDPGEYVSKGQTLAVVHAGTTAALHALVDDLGHLLQTKTAPDTPEPSEILEVWA